MSTTNGGGTLPQIIVIADAPERVPEVVVLREWVAPADLESDHFAGHLVERVGWAVVDAEEIEHRAAPRDRPV